MQTFYNLDTVSPLLIWSLRH